MYKYCILHKGDDDDDDNNNNNVLHNKILLDTTTTNSKIDFSANELYHSSVLAITIEEKEDVSSNWVNLSKNEMLELERRSTRLHSVENSLWIRLRTGR